MQDRWRRGAAAGGLFLACSACPAIAMGAELGRGIALEWSAPPGCPDAAWAQRAILGYLGRRKLESVKPMDVRVEIGTLPGGRFRAVISLGGGASGDRRFEGASCARVGDAAVLIVALMFDPVEVVTQMEMPAEPRRTQAVLANGEAHTATSGRARRSIELAFQAAGDVGSLPEPTLGVGLAAGVRFARTSFGADATVWFPRRGFGGPTAGSGGEISLYTASLRACFATFRVLEERLGLEPCLRAEGGISSGRGFGIAEPTSSSLPWGAALIGLSIRQVTAESLSAWLSIEGGVPFVRPHYIIEDFGPVFRAGPVIGRVAFGLAWAFP
jgi:hypothetical protein